MFFQVHYPSNPLQPGPIYFKTPRKCALFGVCNEGKNEQLTYLIDEEKVASKGANTVISLVHDYLHRHDVDHDAPLVLHADNCWYVCNITREMFGVIQVSLDKYGI